MGFTDLDDYLVSKPLNHKNGWLVWLPGP